MNTVSPLGLAYLLELLNHLASRHNSSFELSLSASESHQRLKRPAPTVYAVDSTSEAIIMGLDVHM